ncbi:MAG: hypothetical protein HC925_00520 [Coleofasciculaceae cyanobacterium SM2_3_26]|nr:hypothetical protein [Coleofasciculaceae cyanobacterium SM2_3_26]
MQAVSQQKTILQREIAELQAESQNLLEQREKEIERRDRIIAAPGAKNYRPGWDRANNERHDYANWNSSRPTLQGRCRR